MKRKRTDELELIIRIIESWAENDEKMAFELYNTQELLIKADAYRECANLIRKFSEGVY